MTTRNILVVSGIGIVTSAVFLIAIISPPNTWDSMTYHMSRVEHWIQNRSVVHYPTHIVRQVFLNPFAEFAILHLQLLSGSDRFANLVQFLSMVGCLAGVSLIARRLGAGAAGQIVAAAVCATIPMGILQASSTQNDYVVAFWLACFVSFSLDCRRRPTLANAAFAGGALGLAVLTKATAYLFVLPYAIWLAAIYINRLRWRAWKPAAAVLVLFLAVNAGHFARNQALFGTPLGRHESASGESVSYINETFTVPLFLSNVARNVSLHLATNQDVVDAGLARAVGRFHEVLGVGTSDPRTTFNNIPFRFAPISFHEDETGNSVHFYLGLAALAGFLVVRRVRTSRPMLLYLLSVIGGFLIFCGLLRWQPWCNRLHLPLFVLFAPFIAVCLDGLANRRIAEGVSTVVAVLLLVLSYPWVFRNACRPLLGERGILRTPRMDLYFANNPQLAGVYTRVADTLCGKNIRRAGLVMGDDDWEYPLWVLLRDRFRSEVNLRHVRVRNTTAAAGQERWEDVPPVIVEWRMLVLFQEKDELGRAKEPYMYAWDPNIPEPQSGCLFRIPIVFGANGWPDEDYRNALQHFYGVRVVIGMNFPPGSLKADGPDNGE